MHRLMPLRDQTRVPHRADLRLSVHRPTFFRLTWIPSWAGESSDASCSRDGESRPFSKRRFIPPALPGIREQTGRQDLDDRAKSIDARAGHQHDSRGKVRYKTGLCRSGSQNFAARHSPSARCQARNKTCADEYMHELPDLAHEILRGC